MARRRDPVLTAATTEPPAPLPKRPQPTGMIQRAVFGAIAQMEKKFGAEVVQATLRRYLNHTRERRKRLEEIADLQRELRELEAKERRNGR
jgi:hypothetical protein